jgi:predicted NBD/HSP70 family sugar kinase
MIGTTVGQFEQSIDGSGAPETLVRKAVTVAAQRGKVSISRLSRVVLNASGPLASTTSIDHTERSGRQRALPDALNGWLGNRISMETSGNLAAIAEAEKRSPDGIANFILVWFEVGVTLAFWLNGALYRGSDNENAHLQSRKRPRDSGRSPGAAAMPAAQTASWQEIPGALSSVATLCAALAPQAVVLGGRTDSVRLTALAGELRQELSACAALPAVAVSSSLDETVLQGAVLAGLQSVRDELWSN